LRVLFIEPPKDFWFIMGEYIPPPFAILTLAGYLESKNPNIEIEVIDCQVEKLDWDGLKKRIESFRPDVVAPNTLSTCNVYTVLRTAELAKSIDPSIRIIVGGRHFTSLADETLRDHSDIDIIIRGEGEQSLNNVVRTLKEKKPLSNLIGISYRRDGKITHAPDGPLIEDLDALPYPAYHFVSEYMEDYYFSLMAEKDSPFAIIEGSRGCRHNCSYCTQWNFWRRNHRAKSPKRIVDELEYVNMKYGSRFFWMTDDNMGLGKRVSDLCDEILKRDLNGVTWFCQARCDDIVNNKNLIPKMRRAGNIWMLVGFDTPDTDVLEVYRRNGVTKSNAKKAVKLLRSNDIFSQGTFIIGERRDSRESIEALKEYADWLDPDIATFMTLTPYPGTEIYEIAKRNGWIEDTNWNNYDMIHAIMPTEHLSREEVQEKLYECYRTFFGSWNRRYQGLLSKNIIARRTYQYLAKKAILTGLRNLF